MRPRPDIREEKEEGPERKLSIIERDVQSQAKLHRVGNTGYPSSCATGVDAQRIWPCTKVVRIPDCVSPGGMKRSTLEKPVELVKVPQWYQLRLQENSVGTSEEGVYPTGASYELAQQFPERYERDAVEGNFPPGLQSLQLLSEERIRNARVLIMMDSTMMPHVRHFCLLPDVVCVTMCNSTLEQMEAAVLVLADTDLEDPDFRKKMPQVVVFMNLVDHLAAKKQLRGVLSGKQIELATATYARYANNLRIRWERKNVTALFESPPGFCQVGARIATNGVCAG